MDGTIGRLDEICDLAENHNAYVFVDECHGMGVLGTKGRGGVEFKNVLDRVHLISSTMGKALGGANGGFITGRYNLIQKIRESAPALYKSSALCQFVAAACIKSLELLENNPQII